MTPAHTAAAEFRSLQASAPRAVAAGMVSREAAERKLQCWLAMACLADREGKAGAGPEEIDRLLPQFRTTMVYRPQRGWQEETFPEREARLQLALQLARRGEWAPVLAEALAKALAAEPSAERTRGLYDLAALLDVSLSEMPAVAEPRKAA